MLRTEGDDGLTLVRRAVPNGDRVAGLDEVLRHGRAHDPEAEEANPGLGFTGVSAAARAAAAKIGQNWY